jgi:hypothetical protein
MVWKVLAETMPMCFELPSVWWNIVITLCLLLNTVYKYTHSFSISRSIWHNEKVKNWLHIAPELVYHFISQGLQSLEVKGFTQHSIYIFVALCWTEVPHWWLFGCKISVTIEEWQRYSKIISKIWLKTCIYLTSW